MTVFTGWSCGEAALAPLVARLGTRAGVVLGWSLGALRALELAVDREPGERLILIAGTPRFCAADDYPCGRPPSELRALARRLQRAPAATVAGFRELAGVADELAGETPSLPALAADLSYLATVDLRERLGDLDLPVLLLHGADDTLIPPAASRWLAERLPQATLVELPGLGHNAPLVAPALLAERMVSWLS